MKKIGRNDPCPCGSGLKYKKCCGKSNVIPFTPLRLEEELEELSQELVDFAFSYYQKVVEDITLDLLEMNLPEDTDDSDKESYVSLIFSWIIMNEPIDNDQTIFEMFAKWKMHQIKNPRVKQAFTSWEQAKSSIFEVVSVDDGNEENIMIREILSDETYIVMHHEVNKLNKGDFIIGTLLPFIQSHYFMFSAVSISKEASDIIYDILDSFILDKEINHALFPEWVGNLIAPPEDELEWLDPLYKEVAMQFAYHMDKKDVDEDTILNGIIFWNDYCLKHQPYVTKTSTYAAALDYFINLMLLPENYVTQVALAKEYEVSSGTISSHHQKFIREYEQLAMEDSLNSASPNNHMPDMPSSPFGMEKEMTNLQKLINEQEFESEEELETFLDGLLENGTIDHMTSDTPEDKAQDLIYQAVEKQGKERKKLIEQALRIDPSNIDAYVLLAENERNLEKSKELLVQAIKIGEKELGAEFFKENKGHFWGMIESRPYMRAKESLAYLLESNEQRGDAAEIYEELLALNPGDNQGIRSVLLPLYIELKMYEAALDLINEYEENPSTDFLYSHALLHFLMKGNTKQTNHLLKIAIKHNQYVVDYLSGRKEVPNETFNYIDYRGETEAVVYAQRNGHLWVDAIKLFEMN